MRTRTPNAFSSCLDGNVVQEFVLSLRSITLGDAQRMAAQLPFQLCDQVCAVMRPATLTFPPKKIVPDEWTVTFTLRCRLWSVSASMRMSGYASVPVATSMGARQQRVCFGPAARS